MARLLSLNSYHYRRGGSDVVYLDHAALFAQNGWDTHFFSMQHPKNLSCPDQDGFAGLVDMEFAHTLPQKLKVAAKSVYNIEARRKLRLCLQQQAFDVAHLHCVYHHLTPSVLPVLARAGIPVVLTAHDLKLACPAYKMMNAGGICEDCRQGAYWHAAKGRCIKGQRAASLVVTAEAYLHRALKSYQKHLAKIICPSRFYQEKLMAWGWQAHQTTYIPNFAPRMAPGFSGDYTGNILFFGRLSQEKGLATLIKAAAMAGVAVDIAGTGPQSGDLQDLAARMGAPVRFLGRLDGPDLWRTVGQARAVVIPSEWYENAPMSVLESYQLDRPVIGADIGGIPELVKTGRDATGWLFPHGDASLLSRALRSACQAPDEVLQEMGRRASAMVNAHFSPQQYYQRMSALYRSL